jgi:hypothetical protein
MAIYSNGLLVIDNTGNVIPAKYTTRTSLSATSTPGYIAYLSDINDFVFSTNRYPSTGPSGNNYDPIKAGGSAAYYSWYKFVAKPSDYKNEIIIQQGCVSGGYVGGNIWSQILRVHHSCDVALEQPQTLSFTNYYGGWHSSEWYAYHHQGNSSVQANKQDWSSWTVTVINNRPTASYSPNSWHNGTKVGSNNNYGMIQIGGTGNYLNYNTDGWGVGYNTGGSHSYGAGVPAENNYGYNFTSGQGGVYRWNYNTMSPSSGLAGEAPYGGGTAGKAMPSKYFKWWMNPNASSAFSRFNVASESWQSSPSSQYNNGEQCCVMGQDYGYHIAGYNGAQNNVSQKQYYPSDSIQVLGAVYSQRNQSSGSACYGPIP